MTAALAGQILKNMNTSTSLLHCKKNQTARPILCSVTFLVCVVRI